MIYEVIGGDESVRVEGDNWLMALGASLEFFGLDPSGLARLAIDMRPDGDVKVKDPLTGRAFELHPVVESAAPGALRIKLGAMQTALESLPEDERDLEPEPPTEPGKPPPALIMPTSIFAPPPELAPLPDDPVDVASHIEPAPVAPPPAPVAPPPAPVAPPPRPVVPASAPPRRHVAPPPPMDLRTTIPTAPPVAPPREARAAPPPTVVDFSALEALDSDEVPGTELPGTELPGTELPGTELPEEPMNTASRAPHVRQPSQPEDDRPSDLHEQLFFESMEITAAGTIDRACQEALRIVQELVPSDSGAVLYASINDTSLTFVAASGPAARKVLGQKIPVDTGVAGFCHLRGVGLVLQDVGTSETHDPSVDQRTGYTTKKLLSAGIRDQSGNSFGCIQLLNPPGDFRDWHLEAVQVIASELADFIALRQ